MRFSSVILTLVSFACFGQGDLSPRDAKTLDSLNQVYSQQLRDDPASATPHWNYARGLGSLKGRISQKAPQYFVKALTIDRTNPSIYFDYASYLENIGDLKGAQGTFVQGQKLSNGDARFEEALRRIREKYDQQKLYWHLHMLPAFQPVDIAGRPSFRDVTNFQSIRAEAVGGPMSFTTLKEKFERDPASMTPKEVYHLLVACTSEEFYNPYDDSDELRIVEMTKAGNITEAVSLGESLIAKEVTNLQVLRELYYCYQVLDQTAKALQAERKLKKIFDGLQYSGNGTCDWPYFTQTVKEEYIFCEYLGYKSFRIIDSNSKCRDQYTDKLAVRNERGEESNLFFNYTLIAEHVRQK